MLARHRLPATPSFGVDPTVPVWSSGSILVLESNSFMRSIITHLLRDACAEDVVTARTNDSALHVMHDFPPGVLIADWVDTPDPERDCLKLVKRIRDTERAPYRDVPIILLSAPRSRREVEAARDAGVTEFVIKPVSAALLYQRLRAIESQPRHFIQTARFAGPDRRRRPRKQTGPSLKRTADVEAGLTTSIQAARSAASALAQEVLFSGDPLAMRVGQSLRRFTDWIDVYTPEEAEIVDMHRATLAQLSRMKEMGNPLRDPVINGLEEVVAKRMGET